MRYIDADSLKAEIERRNLSNRYITTEGYEEELYEIIDSLQQEQDILVINKKDWEAQEKFRKNKDFGKPFQQEQPEVDFKIEERKWVHDAVDNVFPEDGDLMSEVDFRKILKDTARHFYELGLNSRKGEIDI